MSPLAFLELARPAALATLLLPPVFLLLVRLLARPPELVTGTLGLWRELAPSTRQGTRRRGAPPAWAWACAAALLLGAGAAVGPRGVRAAAPRTWTLLVDLTPSMGLPLGEGTRLERALERAEAWLRDAAAGTDRVVWSARGRTPLELAPGVRPPGGWLAIDALAEAPRWALHDLPGTLWITDADPGVVPRRAGLFRSGGDAVEGPVASDAEGLIAWRDGALVRTGEPATGRVLVRELGAALPPVLGDVLDAWCAARGHLRTGAVTPGTVLVLEVRPDAGAGAGEELRVARDGWSARARGGLTPVEDAGGPEAGAEEVPGALGGEAWLVGRAPDGAEVPLVVAAPGRVRIGLRELGEPAGDPTRFVVSWARLLDRCARPAPGVVPLPERVSAGEARDLPGAPPPAGRGDDLGPYVDAGLALGAALLAGLAFVLRG